MQDQDTMEEVEFAVVVNHEEQYSIWPTFKGEPPNGWRAAGKSGKKAECLDYIKEVWTDMRPLSLREKMAEAELRRPELEREHAEKLAHESKKRKSPKDDIVKYLSTGLHPVEPGLRPEKTAAYFKEAIDRGYVLIKFLDTRGGTELGVRLEMAACDFSGTDFETKIGNVHLEGTLTLNSVKVRCIADISLESLEGKGKLKALVEAEA